MPASEKPKEQLGEGIRQDLPVGPCLRASQLLPRKPRLLSLPKVSRESLSLEHKTPLTPNCARRAFREASCDDGPASDVAFLRPTSVLPCTLCCPPLLEPTHLLSHTDHHTLVTRSTNDGSVREGRGESGAIGSLKDVEEGMEGQPAVGGRATRKGKRG